MTVARQRFIVLMTLTVGLLIITALVAIGRVEEKSSFQLGALVTIVGSGYLKLCTEMVEAKDKESTPDVQRPPESPASPPSP